VLVDDARDRIEWNPEWSRRGRGVPTYAALLQLGGAGVAELVERTCAHAHALVTRIGSLSGAQVVWEPDSQSGPRHDVAREGLHACLGLQLADKRGGC
jgi:glutamate/tyrosine decarboxylase-like PLP-dependent enzyme